MSELKKHKGLFYYFTITYVVSWLLWLPAVLESQNLIICQYNDFLVKLGAFVPSTVGLFITLFYCKITGVKRLLKKAVKLKIHILWYAFIFLLMPSITFFSYIITNWTTGVKCNSILLPLLRANLWTIIPMILYFVILQGPFGEEFGWRGYALELLLQRWNPFISSLILGLFWAVWHLPLFFITDTIQNILAEKGIVITFIGYVLYTIMLTIQITVLYIKTGRNLLSVMLFHAIANFSHGLFTVILTPVGGITVLLLMFVITAIIVIIHRDFFLFERNV